MEARYLPLKNELKLLRPRCGAKRPIPQVPNVSNRLAFRIVPKVFPSALDLDEARFFATQLNVVTTFRDHDGGRSLTSPYFYRQPSGHGILVTKTPPCIGSSPGCSLGRFGRWLWISARLRAFCLISHVPGHRFLQPLPSEHSEPSQVQ